MKILFLFLIAVLSYSSLQAQRYSTTSKKAIKYYENAENLFRARQFDDAVKELKKAIKADNNFAEAHFKLATTYQLFQEYMLSFECFKNTVKASPDAPKFKNAHYQLAWFYLKEGNYEEAKKAGEQFLILSDKTPDKNIENIKKLIIDCNFAKEAMKNPFSFQPKLLPNPLNQFFLQYFPAITADQKMLVFTARKSEKRGDDDENLMVSYQNEPDKWTNPKSISVNINTEMNEGTASISADGKVLVFTACNERGGKSIRDIYGECDIFISYKTGEDWSMPENLGAVVNSRNWDSQPTLSADGKVIYFVSNRTGGKGGRDIWVTKKGEDGKWSAPENLDTINTNKDEVSPFIHPDGKTLFFSSAGYEGLGGYDLYKTEKINKQWIKPQNLGYPINTHQDELALFLTADGQKGYYSIDKNLGRKELSSLLYVFDVPQSIQPKQKSNFVKGIVYDAKTKEKLGSTIDLFDINEKTKLASTSSDAKNGDYMIVITEGSEYALEVHKKGYAFKSMSFNYTETKEMKPIEIDIPLEPITKGTVFRLNNIFFDYNKFQLKDKSKTELDELIKFMKDNADIKGEISGHTDNIGKAEDNITLSLNRAKSVYEYLIDNGIDKTRLTFKGYGATKPDFSNDNEENRAKNRRIEFKIL